MGGSREGHAIRPDVGLPHLSEDWKVPARWALTNPSAVRSEATKARATDKGWPWPEPSRGQLTASGRSNLLPEVAVPWRRASVSPEAWAREGPRDCPRSILSPRPWGNAGGAASCPQGSRSPRPTRSHSIAGSTRPVPGRGLRLRPVSCHVPVPVLGWPVQRRSSSQPQASGLCTQTPQLLEPRCSRRNRP